MIIAELPFEQFNSILQGCAKKKEFELIIYLVARNADTPKLFNEIEANWSSLHDITGKNILFVVVNGQSHKWTSNRNQIEGEYGFHLFSPYCLLSSSIDTRIGFEERWFGKYVVPINELENPRRWREQHNIAMTEVATALNLSESDIPCLNFYIVTADKNISFPLKHVSSNFSLYLFIKKIKETNNFFGKKKQFEERDLLNSSKKYKKYDIHSKNLRKAISTIDIDIPTKSWIESVLSMDSKDKNVYNKIVHLKSMFEPKEFTKFRAALNCLVDLASDAKFKDKLNFKENGTQTFSDSVTEFEMLLEKSINDEY
ncbi:MAG TPA: hypothetical protein VIK55_21185 [Paludibacter sp.]